MSACAVFSVPLHAYAEKFSVLTVYMGHSGTPVGFCSCADQFVSDLFEITEHMFSRQDDRIEDRVSLVFYSLVQSCIFELSVLSRFEDFFSKSTIRIYSDLR